MKVLFLTLFLTFKVFALESLSSCPILESYENSIDIIGKSISSSTVRNAFYCLGRGEISYYDDSIYFSYPKFGYGIRIENKQKKITSVFLYNTNRQGYYLGRLPHDISFLDNQTVLWSFLGLPEKDYKMELNNKTIVAWENYVLPELGLKLHISYGSITDDENFGEQISHLVLSKP